MEKGRGQCRAPASRRRSGGQIGGLVPIPNRAAAACAGIPENLLSATVTWRELRPALGGRGFASAGGGRRLPVLLLRLRIQPSAGSLAWSGLCEQRDHLEDAECPNRRGGVGPQYPERKQASCISLQPFNWCLV